ncbi:DEAD box ATP-dependent RNA helicase [Culex quinquefasciatus]|uniref:DEAD box ATP-dependent RNA helicase n=1 Tax=Culex quinquefasciatus TaxID=7176 RepID=B0WAW6_CULQU|nr:DEAD box ATP-dependent RNA helicase [Culex quinquefasciatus]|eukprot:XP_001845850.1 DEAD box ATP-dependent RNA helicase [Culex quinquefasciatus]
MILRRIEAVRGTFIRSRATEIRYPPKNLIVASKKYNLMPNSQAGFLEPGHNNLTKEEVANSPSRFRRKCMAALQEPRTVRDGDGATSIHGNKSQWERDYVLQIFRHAKSTTLVVTYVASDQRGGSGHTGRRLTNPAGIVILVRLTGETYAQCDPTVFEVNLSGVGSDSRRCLSCSKSKPEAAERKQIVAIKEEAELGT